MNRKKSEKWWELLVGVFIFRFLIGLLPFVMEPSTVELRIFPLMVSITIFAGLLQKKPWGYYIAGINFLYGSVVGVLALGLLFGIGVLQGYMYAMLISMWALSIAMLFLLYKCRKTFGIKKIIK